MQGAQILRNEAYLWYVAMTKDDAQRRRWTFYEVVKDKQSQTIPSYGKLLKAKNVANYSP